MRKPLERLKKLTLSLEAAATSNDWCAFKALLDAREKELSTLPPGVYEEAEEFRKLDARLQASVNKRMNHLRSRMQTAAHVNRTARAFQSAQARRERVDFAG